MALLTYAEVCSEVAGMLEISATDYTRMNIERCANRALRFILTVAPAELAPECVRIRQYDFEVTGALEVPLDFIRVLRVMAKYSSGVNKEVQPAWIPPDQWPPTGTNVIPTEDNPQFTIVADFLGIATTNGRGLIWIMPWPAAKVTAGVRLSYVGTGDAIDSSHGVPLNPGLWGPFIHKTCEYVCMVENYDVARAQQFREAFREEMQFIAERQQIKLTRPEGK